MSPKLAIGVPSSGLVSSAFMERMVSIISDNENIKLIHKSGPLLSYNRNYIVEQFLLTDCEWLLMLDSDILVDGPGLDNLIDLISSQPEVRIVGGAYYIQMGEAPVIAAQLRESDNLNWVKDISEELIEVVSIGTGMLAVHRSIFEEIRSSYPGVRYPWFRDFSDENNVWMGEDWYFCSLAHKIKKKIYLLTTFRGKHLKLMSLGEPR